MHFVDTQTERSDASPVSYAKQYVRHLLLPSNPMNVKMEPVEPLDTTLIYSSACTVDFVKKPCPVDSIVMTDIHEFHYENRGEQVITKQELLAIGDQYEDRIAEARRMDSPYR